MSEMILWINAQADNMQSSLGSETVSTRADSGPSVDELPPHSFPGQGRQRPNPVSGEAGETTAGHPSLDGGSDEQCTQAENREHQWEEMRRRAAYRGRTVSMLRRYMRYSMETGRLPSLLGREFFRAKVTRHTAITFEDRVIYAHDMETCLHRLDDFSQKVIGRIVLQEYSHEEAAGLLGCARITVHRALLDALDQLGSILLRVGLMERLHWRSEKSCQEGNSGTFPVTSCNYGK